MKVWNLFAPSCTTVLCIVNFIALAIANHSHTISLLYSFPVFLSLRSSKPLLHFSHWFIISDFASNRSPLRIPQSQTSPRSVLVPTCLLLLLQSLLPSVDMENYTYLRKPTPKTKRSKKNFGYFTISHDCLVIFSPKHPWPLLLTWLHFLT